MVQNTTLLNEDGKSEGSCEFCSRAYGETCKMSLTSYHVRAMLKTTGASN